MASVASVTSNSSSSTHLLHHLFRHQKPPSCVCLFLRPLCVSTITHQPNHRHEPRFRPFFASPSSSLSPPPSTFFSHSLSSLPLRSLPAKFYSSIHELEHGEMEEEEENGPVSAQRQAHDDTEEENEEGLGRELLSLQKNEDFDPEIEGSEGFDVAAGISEVGSGSREMVREKTEKSRTLALRLSVKEKKELASYANSLGKKLKCQLVGKSGVTDTVVSSFVETLEKNELLKIKIHRTCPGELEDVVRHLEEATGSVVVGQIGRTVIVYRPSLTKLKAEEKRKETQRMFARKTSKLTPTLPKKVYAAGAAVRGRRGVSRVSTA